MRPVAVATCRYLGRDRLIQARVHALVCKHACLLIGYWSLLPGLAGNSYDEGIIPRESMLGDRTE
ncbi:hypothetical protein I7I48_02822 [Histoplasma ohiense]|nr:hypothetical protein I7I48_02822 [Histoplasma ohiense (nom. inval.)]